VDHDFLPVRCRVEVRHDANSPPGGVGFATLARKSEDLRRSPVLATLAEGALVELARLRRLDRLGACSGSSPTTGRKDD
jgi:hypothetical protein